MEPLNILQFSPAASGISPASIFSLAGAGFNLLGSGAQAFGAITSAEGTARADEFQAEEADVKAQYGQLQAVQTGAQMTRNLNTTLGNIDAIRAAAHTNPTSPTGAAYRQTQEDIGTEQKTIDVNNIMAQTQQDEADASYYRQAASTALLSGDMSAVGDILGGVGKLGATIGESPGAVAALAPLLAA